MDEEEVPLRPRLARAPLPAPPHGGRDWRVYVVFAAVVGLGLVALGFELVVIRARPLAEALVLDVPTATPAPRRTLAPTALPTLEPTVAPTIAPTMVPTLAPTPAPTALVLRAPATPRVATATTRLAPAVIEVATESPTAQPDADALWPATREQIQAAWATDWSAVVSRAQAFHDQFPDYQPATDLLYTALIEDGRSLADQGAQAEAVDVLDRAASLEPERQEARVMREALLAAAAHAPTASSAVAPTEAAAPAQPVVDMEPEPQAPPEKARVTREGFADSR